MVFNGCLLINWICGHNLFNHLYHWRIFDFFSPLSLSLFLSLPFTPPPFFAIINNADINILVTWIFVFISNCTLRIQTWEGNYLEEGQRVWAITKIWIHSLMPERFPPNIVFYHLSSRIRKRRFHCKVVANKYCLLFYFYLSQAPWRNVVARIFHNAKICSHEEREGRKGNFRLNLRSDHLPSTHRLISERRDRGQVVDPWPKAT